jgi:hypothetical protein
MTCELIYKLTDAQKNQICAVLSVGCDRETAAGVAECSILDIGRALEEDPQFVTRVRRAEATAEFRHMQNILNATNDGRYWRASVWWLEHRSPERFARRSPGAITPEQLKEALAMWNERVQQEFASPEELQRISLCFDDMNAMLESVLDVQSAEIVLRKRESPRRLKRPRPNDTHSPPTSKTVSSSDSANP